MSDVVTQLLADRPSFHMNGECAWNSLPETLCAIREAVQPGDTTLETGVGASTVVFAARGAHHTAISPDAGEHERVAAYCHQIGVATDRLTFIEGFSDDVLPARLGRERKLDAAFIDGAHSFPFPEVDWFYVTRALRVGGRLLMDDISIPAVTPLFHYMRSEPHWRLEAILDDRAAAFTLTGTPPVENWPDQRFNDGYPDFSFVPPVTRMRLKTAFRASQLRTAAAARYPALRRLRGGARAVANSGA
jgi:precorrin-6B methylase 2